MNKFIKILGWLTLFFGAMSISGLLSNPKESIVFTTFNGDLIIYALFSIAGLFLIVKNVKKLDKEK